MPISVEVWNEVRNPVVEVVLTDVRLPQNLFDDDRILLLKWIDPYGTTVFNQAQCGRVALEVSLLLETYFDRAWEAVRALAEQCRDESHTYLVFEGD
jgi:hypothetical protein